MLIWFRSLFRFFDSRERYRQIERRMADEAMARRALLEARGARDVLLERDLKRIQDEERKQKNAAEVNPRRPASGS